MKKPDLNKPLAQPICVADAWAEKDMEVKSRQTSGTTNQRMIKTTDGRMVRIPDGLSERTMQLIGEKAAKLAAVKKRMGKKEI